MPRTQREQPETTVVDGVGMWDEWTMKYEKPLPALSDLLDNAFDATGDEEFQGLIHVYPDKEPQTNTVSGVAIVNNSYKHIKPMDQVLVAFRSSKGDQSVGENGIGLKQGCACLSDLSFALSKNKGEYSIGIIAKSLQREDGCVLPSFSFANFPQKEELQELFMENHIVGQCIEEYGGGSLDNGIDRLLGHYERMLKLEDRHHVFCLILHELKHNFLSGEIVVDVDSSDDDAFEVDFAQNAKFLMTKLKMVLPRQYIHTPSRLEVKVDGKKVEFYDWQKRLVELSSFQVKVDPKKPITKTTKDWKDPANGYTLKIYAGFDPARVQATSQSALSLFVYSRQSGRLILQEADGRNTLGLPTGGTEYSQGLTIIVDDCHGNLPLNSTKQGLAFAHKTHGETQYANLMNWVGAFAKLFWHSQAGKFLEETHKAKGLLTDELKSHVRKVQALQRQSLVIPRLRECELSTFVDVRWCLKGRDRVSLVANDAFRSVVGVDTLFTIQETQARLKEKEEKKQTPKKRKATTKPTTITPPSASTSSRKKKKQAVATTNSEEEVNEVSPPAASRVQLYENEMEQSSPATPKSQDRHRHGEVNSRLERKVAKYRTKVARYKEELGKKVAEVAELQQENASLKEEHHQAASINNTSNNEDLDAANRKIEELQKSLHEATRRAEIAEVETQIQQETANEYRKKYAELRAASTHVSI